MQPFGEYMPWREFFRLFSSYVDRAGYFVPGTAPGVVDMAGTKVGVWYKTGGKTAAMSGTRFLADSFNWFEKTYGAYPCGSEVGSVSADWGGGDYGGMEHHPYWHIGRTSMNDMSAGWPNWRGR